MIKFYKNSTTNVGMINASSIQSLKTQLYTIAIKVSE